MLELTASVYSTYLHVINDVIFLVQHGFICMCKSEDVYNRQTCSGGIWLRNCLDPTTLYLTPSDSNYPLPDTLWLQLPFTWHALAPTLPFTWYPLTLTTLYLTCSGLSNSTLLPDTLWLRLPFTWHALTPTALHRSPSPQASQLWALSIFSKRLKQQALELLGIVFVVMIL